MEAPKILNISITSILGKGSVAVRLVGGSIFLNLNREVNGSLGNIFLAKVFLDFFTM